jgi:hypothetical protein
MLAKIVSSALIATTVAGAGSTSSLVLWAVVGGLAGALALNLAYFFGVVLVGAAVGAMAVTLLWSRASGDPHVLIVVAFRTEPLSRNKLLALFTGIAAATAIILPEALSAEWAELSWTLFAFISPVSAAIAGVAWVSITNTP